MKIDFRTKLFMTIVLSCILLLGNLQKNHTYIAMIACSLPYILFLIYGFYSRAIKGIILVLIAAIFQEYLYTTDGILLSISLFVTSLVLNMLPGAMMGSFALSTTDMGEIIATMKKMKIPDQLIIPISVMARFFYTVRIDYSQIRQAMYLNGLVGIKMFLHPLKLFEYRVVPLLMCLTKTSDEVAISAITRGLEVGAKRSSMYEPKLSLFDYILIITMILLAILAFEGGSYA